MRQPPDRPIELGAHPLAPSVRVEPSGPSTALIRLDAFGAFPLFIAGTPAALGDSLPEVAAHADVTGTIDPVTVIGRIAFECDIGPHTLLTDVRRMLPGEVAEVDFTSGEVTIGRAPLEPPRPDPLSFLIALAGAAFHDGADLELTGGYDSRLVLALGCAAGCLPRTTITMGEPGGFDVDCASRISRRLGIPHRIISYPRLDDPDWEAVRRFWVRTGCAVDPFEYAWIPSTFGSGFPPDRTQLSGVGGEIGSGFYAFRGDEALLRVAGWRRLIHHRMAKRGHHVPAMGPEARSLMEAAVSRVMDRVGDARSWREFGLRIYLEDRCRSWAGSILAGSATLYRPLAPLLSPEYGALSAAVGATERGRAWQHGLIGRLEPRLVQFPFRKRWALVRKLQRRWSRQPSAARRPDPLRREDHRIRDAFELGCLQLGWSSPLAHRHAGVVTSAGWLEQERTRLRDRIVRERSALPGHQLG